VQDDRLTLVVRDNGRGFDPAVIGGKGFGLTSMRERASLIGGGLNVVSRPRDGTRVEVDVPLSAGAAADLRVDEAHRN
jgi:signal transduction histidine kinase